MGLTGEYRLNLNYLKDQGSRCPSLLSEMLSIGERKTWEFWRRYFLGRNSLNCVFGHGSVPLGKKHGTPYADFQCMIKGDAFQLPLFPLLVPLLRVVAER